MDILDVLTLPVKIVAIIHSILTDRGLSDEESKIYVNLD